MRIHLRDRLLADFLRDDYGLNNNVQTSTLQTAELFDISISRIAIREARHEHAAVAFNLSTRVRVLNNQKHAYTADMTAEDITYANLAYKYITDLYGLQISDTVDFLRSSVNLDSEWLYRCDSRGRQMKLMKCGSFDQLQHEHDKHFEALHAKLKKPHPQLTEADQIVIDDIAGYQLFQLLTPAALDHEGQQLRHCIGFGSYDEKLQSDDERFYSIRKDGKSLATLHVKDSEHGPMVVQYRGWRNCTPDVAYFEIFEEKMGWVTIIDSIRKLKGTLPSNETRYVGF